MGMVRFSCLAHGPSVIDEDIGKAPPPVFWQQLFDVLFNLVRVLVFREAKFEGKPFDVRIYHHTRDIKGRT